MTQVDRATGLRSNTAIKQPCKVATTANITLSGLQTIDGIALAQDDRVLVKDQTTASQNGLYRADSGTWNRAPDWDGANDVKKGTLVYVHSGSTNTGFWFVSTADTITIGTTSVTIERASSVLAAVSAFVQTLLDDATAADFLATLDAELAAIAGLVSVADRLPYFTGSGAAALATFTAFARTLVDDADAATARGTLHVGVRGHLAGLTLSNNTTDADHDLDIAVGEASSDDTDPVLMKLTSAFTKQLDATFAEGSAAGGFASGESLPTSGTIHIWEIAKTDGTVDVFANDHATSALAPTLPTGFTLKRRIGSRTTDSSANIIGATQFGDRVLLNTVVNDFNVNDPGTSAVLRAVAIPNGLSVVWLGHGTLFDISTANNVAVLYSSPHQSDTAPVFATLGQLMIAGATNDDLSMTTTFQIVTNTSAQIRTRASFSSVNITISGTTEGWIDRRGRDD